MLKQKIELILAKIENPLNNKDIITSNLLKKIEEVDDKVKISLTNIFDRQLQLKIEASIRSAIINAKITDKPLRITFDKKATQSNSTSTSSNLDSKLKEKPSSKLPNIKKIIGISSGKGGVGKSTVALNLAATLTKQKYKVGLLDADIYGPSMGKMLNEEGKIDLTVKNNKIIPLKKYKIKCISFSFFLNPKQAVVWRGPMLGKAIEQFLFDVEWGKLDYLIIDLPPGTGDVHLSLVQVIQLDGVYIVTTPQKVAQIDVERSVEMFAQVNVPVLGVIENMSSFSCPHCNCSINVFGSGAGQSLANSFNIPLIAQIPLSRILIESGEIGIPITEKNKDWKALPKELEKVQEQYNKLTQALTQQ